MTHAEHIAFLCTTHGVTCEFRTSGGRAWRKSRRISIAPVKSAITYAIALHELGHVLGQNSGSRLDKEVQAWDWARANAQEWTDVMDRSRARMLGTYIAWAERRQKTDRRGRMYITPSHPVWKYAESPTRKSR